MFRIWIKETKLSSKHYIRFKVIWSRPDYFCSGSNLFCTGLWGNPSMDNKKKYCLNTISKLNYQFCFSVYVYGSPEFQFIFCRQEESWVIDEISPQSPTAAKFNASQKKPEMSRQYAFLRDRPSTFPIFYTKIEFFSYIFIEY